MIRARSLNVVFWLGICSIAAFLLAPTLVAVPISFSATNSLQIPPAGLSLRWYAAVLTDPQWRDAASNSLQVAVLTSICSVLLGTPAAIALQHGNRFIRTAANGVILSPLVIPVVVLSIATYMIFTQWGLSGSLIGLVVRIPVYRFRSWSCACARASQCSTKT